MELKRNFGSRFEGIEYSYNKIKIDYDLVKFLNLEARRVLTRQIRKLFNLHRGYSWKTQIELHVRFVKQDPDKEANVITIDTWLNTKQTDSIYLIHQVKDILTKCFDEIRTRAENFIRQGSGWIFDRVLGLHLSVAKFIPLSGGRISTPRLPLTIMRKRACYIPKTNNTTSETDRCFLDAVLASHVMHVRGYKALMNADIHRIRRYEQFYDTSNLSFPTPLNQISVFEKRNKLSIYVYGWRLKRDFNQTRTPLSVLYMSKTCGRTVDILLYRNHYYMITDLSCMLGTHVSGRGARQKKYICRSCLCFYLSHDKLITHQRFCDLKGQVYILPQGPKTILKFESYNGMIASDHCIYYDFETCLTPVKSTMKTDKKLRHHIPIAVSAIRVCVNPAYNSSLFTHVGLDCVSQFVQWLRNQTDEATMLTLHYFHPLEMRGDDWDKFTRTEYCEMCGTRFEATKDKCRDHSHLTGRYRFALYNSCNLTHASRDRNIPVVAHNATKYDSHLIINELAEVCRQEKLPLKIMARNREHYLTIYFDRLQFLDSFQFLNGSLDKIVESREKTQVSFPLMNEYVCGSQKKFELLCRKGVFCYNYIDSPEKLHMKSLPTKADFYDDLKETDISNAQYEHAQQVWETMMCKSMEDYIRVYLETDVLLLADCFEDFRKTTMKNFHLDPCKFLSTPHVAFNAMLKMTRIQIQLLPQIDMVNFIKSGIRGGVASIMHRYAEANLPGEPGYNPEKPRAEILYLDVCNLYGYALSRPLPVGEFRWMNQQEVDKFDLSNIPHNSRMGFIVECDLTYPENLHDMHNDFPLAAEKMMVQTSDWSSYMHKLATENGIDANFRGAEKLIPHLGPRKHYVTHYLNLSYYIKQGMKLEKIHRILTFTQSAFMRPYIDFCTNLREKTNNEFQSNLFKLFSNACYGKLLQNPSHNVNMKLVTTSHQFHKLSRKPNFKSMTIYNKHLAGIEMKPQSMMMNKALQIGMVCLEEAKRHLLKFHYSFMKGMYGDRCKLLFTDTDSLAYLITTEDDMSEVMYENRKYFDLSNYSKDSRFHSDNNKKRRGALKNEAPNDRIIKFVGLRSKMYHLEYASRMSSKRAKGLKHSIVSRFTSADYHQALKLRNDNCVRRNKCRYRSIRSKRHQLYTIEEHKIGLCGFDDKRWILRDGVTTLAHNHYRRHDLQ